MKCVSWLSLEELRRRKVEEETDDHPTRITRRIAERLRLANILDRDCLDKLNKKRSLIRESSRRRIICYASGILVKYLSYWLPSELNLISRYSDIFIAFALLEERINGTMPVSEGILIVRENQ